MATLPPCPQCTLETTCPDGANDVCADCGYEWPIAADATAETAETAVTVRDSHCNRSPTATPWS